MAISSVLQPAIFTGNDVCGIAEYFKHGYLHICRQLASSLRRMMHFYLYINRGQSPTDSWPCATKKHRSFRDPGNFLSAKLP